MQDSRGRTGRRTVAAILALAAVVASALAAAPADAFRVRFETRSAELVITALERGTVNESIVEAIRSDEGYRLVFEHAARSAEPPRRPDAVAAEFLAALDAVAGGGSDPRFRLEAARESRRTLRKTLRAFRRAERRARLDVEQRLKEMLPASADFEATAHLVVGGDAWGVALGDHDDIAIRIDDFAPPDPDAEPDLAPLSAVLAHELFHVGFRAAGGLPPWPVRGGEEWWRLAETWGPNVVGEVWRAAEEPWRPAATEARLVAWVRPATWDWHALDRFLALLSRMQNEGTAVYADAPLRGRAYREQIDLWMSTIDTDLAFLAHVTDRLNRRADADEIDWLAEQGFADDGPLYRVGYAMAARIDKYTGRNALLRTIEHGALEFLEAYFETHPYGPGQIKPATEEELKRIIREIRAVGRFDPEAG